MYRYLHVMPELYPHIPVHNARGESIALRGDFAGEPLRVLCDARGDLRDVERLRCRQRAGVIVDADVVVVVNSDFRDIYLRPIRIFEAVE